MNVKRIASNAQYKVPRTQEEEERALKMMQSKNKNALHKLAYRFGSSQPRRPSQLTNRATNNAPDLSPVRIFERVDRAYASPSPKRAKPIIEPQITKVTTAKA